MLRIFDQKQLLRVSCIYGVIIQSVVQSYPNKIKCYLYCVLQHNLSKERLVHLNNAETNEICIQYDDFSLRRKSQEIDQYFHIVPNENVYL